MDQPIDCLIIGHHAMDLQRYAEMVRAHGEDSGAYRDLSLSLLRREGRFYTVSDAYNTILRPNEPFGHHELFSHTIAYLGSFLERNGLTFDHVNSFQHDRDRLVQLLKSGRVRSIAVTTTLYVSPLPVIEVVQELRALASDVPIIVGGPLIHNSKLMGENQDFQQTLLSSIGADYYICSAQGEAALVQLVKALVQGQEIPEINNLIRRHGERYEMGPEAIEHNSLAENPVDWNRFSPDVGNHASVRSAISCPFRCAFCGFPQRTGKYQSVDIDRIEEELDAIEALGTVQSISFIDDTFNAPPARFKAFLKLLLRKNYAFRWNSYLRCQLIDAETTQMMREARCEGVFLGLESGSQPVLDSMKKRVRVQDYRRGLDLLREQDIVTYGSFIVGFPGETEQTAEETAQFIESSGLTFFRAQLWYCDPCTPIWQQRQKHDIRGGGFEWSHQTMTSQRASEHIERLFLTIRAPVWVPQYGFEMYGVHGLRRRGLDINGIRGFVTAFNDGIREGLKGHNGTFAWNQMSEALGCSSEAISAGVGA